MLQVQQSILNQNVHVSNLENTKIFMQIIQKMPTHVREYDKYTF